MSKLKYYKEGEYEKKEFITKTEMAGNQFSIEDLIQVCKSIDKALTEQEKQPEIKPALESKEALDQ